MGGLKEETKGLSMLIEEMGDKLTEDYHIRMHLTGVVLPPAPGSIQALTIGEHPVVRSNAGSWQQCQTIPATNNDTTADSAMKKAIYECVTPTEVSSLCEGLHRRESYRVDRGFANPFNVATQQGA